MFVTGLLALLLAADSVAATEHTDVTLIPHPRLRGQNAGPAPQTDNGRPEKARQVGSGIEHAHVAVCGSRFLIAGVGSYALDGSGQGPDMGRGDSEDRLQTMMIAGELTPSGLELGDAYYVFPNLNDGDRNRDGMKPQSACLDPEQGLFVTDANYAPDNRARTYAGVFRVARNGAGALYPQQLATATQVLANGNDDCSDRDEHDLLVRPNGTGSYIVNLTGSCNGNGNDVAWITRFNVNCSGNLCTITDQGSKQQVSAGEIERYRPQTFSIGGGAYVAIGTEGDNQPPRGGISATIFNGDTLQVTSRQIIAESVNNGDYRLLSTMSHGAQISENLIIVSYQTRRGRQRNGDGKGSTTLQVGVLEVTPGGNVEWSVAPRAGLIPGFSATHHAACRANFGQTGSEKPASFLVSASTHGGSPAHGTFLTYDESTRTLEPALTVNLQTQIDSALIPNYYGNNPGTQGKNSIYCRSIENPSYGVDGGFMPDVKEFVIVPGTSRIPDGAGTLSPKLGLDVALVPSVIDPESSTEPINGTGGDDEGGNDESPGGASFGTSAGCSAASGKSAPVGLLLLVLVVAIRSRRGVR